MHIKTAGKKKHLVMSQSEWFEIGKKAGWTKVAQSVYDVQMAQGLSREINLIRSRWLPNIPVLAGRIAKDPSQVGEALRHITEACRLINDALANYHKTVYRQDSSTYWSNQELGILLGPVEELKTAAGAGDHKAIQAAANQVASAAQSLDSRLEEAQSHLQIR